jgi:hypothetical protein
LKTESRNQFQFSKFQILILLISAFYFSLMKVPFLELKPTYLKLKDEFDAADHHVMDFAVICSGGKWRSSWRTTRNYRYVQHFTINTIIK